MVLLLICPLAYTIVTIKFLIILVEASYLYIFQIEFDTEKTIHNNYGRPFYG